MPYDFEKMVAKNREFVKAENPHGRCLLMGQGRGEMEEHVVGSTSILNGLFNLKALARQWLASKASQPHRARTAVYVSPSEVHMYYSDGERAATARLEVLPPPAFEPWDNRRRQAQKT